VQEVIKQFQSLNEGQQFVDVCVALPVLKNYLPDTNSPLSDSVRSVWNKISLHKLTRYSIRY
jgi:hypothetical protein